MTDGSGSSSSEQFDQVLADLMRAIDAGETVVSEWWLAEFPQFATELQAFFVKNERMEQLVRPLRQAAANVLHVRCPHCRNPIELVENAPLAEINCPSCGSSFSLVGEKTVTHYSPGERTIGHFQLLDQVGVGAFGSVWKAHDTKLDRTVAIKIPRNVHLDEAQTELFLRDARAAAQLKHPNIVSVHEVGKQDDTIYIVSDFIQGATLKEWTKAKRLTPREAAELCVEIGRALHHAHESGVIHRDLKPGNIMMDTDGEPHIVDFGLAKREAGEITMTVEGQILGTPAYMSPEQARGDGHTVDRRADIYSLGVILFELLTGELPFRGDKQMLLVQILRDDPPSPQKLNSSIPRDLDTICLKCLEKESHKRYMTAELLADDIKRQLSAEPIFARRIGRIERIVKWSRRRPASAALVGVSCSATLMLIVGLTLSNVWIGQALEDRTSALTNLRHQQTLTRNALGEKTLALADRDQAFSDLEVEQEKTNSINRELEIEQNKTNSVNRQLEAQAQQLIVRQRRLYRSLLKLAHAQALGNDVTIADQNLDLIPKPMRGWEWRYVKRLCHQDILKFDRGPAAFSPNGERLAICVEGQIDILDLPDGNKLRSIATPDTNCVAIAWTPDGTKVAAASKNVAAATHVWSVTLWNVTDGRLVLELPHPTPVNDIVFGPDGKQLATAANDAQIRIWNLDTGDLGRYLTLPHDPKTLSSPIDPVISVDFSSDGKWLAGGTSKSITVWNTEDYKNPQPIEVAIQRSFTTSAYRAIVSDVQFAPSRQVLAIANADVVKLWSIERSVELEPLAGHVGTVWAVAFSFDGNRAATASEDGRIRIWNLETLRATRTFSSENDVQSLSFSPDGNYLLSSGPTAVKVWDLSADRDVRTWRIHTDVAFSVAISADSTLFASGGGPRRTRNGSPAELRIRSLATGETTFDTDINRGTFYGVGFGPSGRTVAAVGSGRGNLWDLETGERRELKPEVSRVKDGGRGRFGAMYSAVFSQDGKLLATNNGRLWDAKTGGVLHESLPACNALCFSHDDRLLYTCGAHLSAWSIEEHRKLYSVKLKQGRGIRGFNMGAHRIAISPDGTLVALAMSGQGLPRERMNELIQIRRTSDGELVRMMQCDDGPEEFLGTASWADISIYDVSFSHDGKRVASAGGDKLVRVFDVVTGDQLLSFEHAHPVFAVEFSRDGRWLVSGSGHWEGPCLGEVRVWDAGLPD